MGKVNQLRVLVIRACIAESVLLGIKFVHFIGLIQNLLSFVVHLYLHLACPLPQLDHSVLQIMTLISSESLFWH